MDRNRNNMRFVEMENQLKAKDEYISFIQGELEKVTSEFEVAIEEKVKEKVERVMCENEELKQRLESETKRADKAEAMVKKVEFMAFENERRAIKAEKREQEKDDEITMLGIKLEELRSIKEYVDKAKLQNADLKAIITAAQIKTYCRSSERTRFLNDEIDPDRPELMDMGLDELDRELLGQPGNAGASSDNEIEDVKVDGMPNKPIKSNAKAKTNITSFSKRKHVYRASEIRRVCNIEVPKGARFLRRHDTETGEDVWEVVIFSYEPAKVIQHIYKVGRITIPGVGLQTVGHPEYLIKGNPLHPSFARFYLDSKFGLNLSENRILEMLEDMHTTIPQSSLNLWMHQIMSLLRDQLENLMLEAIRLSCETYNDETRLLVRSCVNDDAKLKYKIEYVHACLSQKEKLIAMIYNEGSRSHEVQEEAFFKDSNIKLFMADRAPLYNAIVKNLKDKQILRAACYVHARRGLVDCYFTDPRVKKLISWINVLFKIERYSKERGHTPQQRLLCRQLHSRKYVDKIFELAREMKLAGDEYGSMVHKALNYLLDDEEAFRVFLSHGEIDISNNAIENLFRHIAMGRRNWLHTGSHQAAQNIAFMYSLYESCKLNDIKFGDYIEDILTRIMKGEKADNTFLPNKWVARTLETGTQTA